MARKLIALTDVSGIQRDQGHPETVISRMTFEEAQRAIETGSISGGMIPKVHACIKALEAGVQNAHIINGNFHHALLLELFTDKGIGTMIVRR
jgi:acetylglutamate kinase